MQRAPRASFEELLEKANAGDTEACYSVAMHYRKGTGVKKNPLETIRWFHKAYENGFSTYRQEIISAFLFQFCNDPRYSHDKKGKKRFTDEAINKLEKGNCAGLTTRFLAGAYLNKNRAHSTENPQEETKGPVAESIRDDLTQFYREIDTILGWDGKRDLNPEEQKQFFSFISLMFGYQHAFFINDIYQSDLDRLVFIDNEESSFKREAGCTLCVTEKQFADILSALKKPNRIVIISIPAHTMGMFDEYFFGPNDFRKNEKYISSAEMARMVFKEIQETGLKYPVDQPITISINIFARIGEPIPAIYPSYSELLLNSAPGTEPDPYYKETALHRSVILGHVESVEHFLKMGNINIKNNKGHTALQLAAMLGRTDCARLLLAAGCDIYVKTPAFIGSTAFNLACRSNNLDVARLLLAHGYPLKWSDEVDLSIGKEEITESDNIARLIQERKDNLASQEVQLWIQKGILPELAAAALSPDQRFILEKATNVAKELNIELTKNRLPLDDTGKKYRSVDEIIRCVLTIIKSAELNNESKSINEEVNAFREAIAAENFVETANVSQIKNALQTAYCKMESCRITQTRFENIKQAYYDYKGKFFTTAPSSESLQMLKQMSSVPYDESSKRAEIALEFIRAHPNNQLAKEIVNVVPGLTKVR